jgi:hypothetical protein
LNEDFMKNWFKRVFLTIQYFFCNLGIL